jgi:multiple sugar transport system ATP-binding protein
MSTISCRELTKRFGDVIAVNRFNLEVADGEFVVLVGPSGCGKTTILRMIAGLESISDGEVLLDNQVVNGGPPRHRDLAMVFQNYALYPHMRVFDNIAYSLRLRHMHKDEIQRRVDEVGEMLGISGLFKRSPTQLSGGQRQRVALGRAIVRQPRGFLMDEPLSNLDAQLRVQMRREIIHLQHRLRITTVYVTHDQVEAMTMGDRIVVMRDGVMQQIGKPHDVYRRPRNTFVARFIGSPAMNMDDGQLVCRDDHFLLQPERPRSTCPTRCATGSDGPAPRAAATSPGVFDRKTSPLRWMVAPNPGAFRGVVDLVEHLGADAYASVNVAGDVYIARVSPDVQLEENQTVSLQLNPSKLHLFDGPSGDSILAPTG